MKLDSGMLQDAFQELGIPIEKMEASKLFEKHFKASNQQVTTEDFVNIVESVSRKRYMKIFQQMDIDGSGELDLKEVKTAFSLLGLEKTDEDLQRIFHEYDSSGDGLIQFDEFSEMIEACLLTPEEELQVEEMEKDIPWAASYGCMADDEPTWDEIGEQWCWRIKANFDVFDVETEDFDSLSRMRPTAYLANDDSRYQGPSRGLYTAQGWRAEFHPSRTVLWNYPERRTYRMPNGSVRGDATPVACSVRLTKDTVNSSSGTCFDMPIASGRPLPLGDSFHMVAKVEGDGPGVSSQMPELGEEREQGNTTKTSAQAEKKSAMYAQMKTRLAELEYKQKQGGAIRPQEEKEISLLIRQIKKIDDENERQKAEALKLAEKEEAGRPAGTVSWTIRVDDIDADGGGMRVGIVHVSVGAGADWGDFAVANNKSFWWNSYSGCLFIGDVLVPDSGKLQDFACTDAWNQRSFEIYQGACWGKGDMLTVNLDLGLGELSFRRNGEQTAHTICGVWGEVFFAVQMSSMKDCVSYLESVERRALRSKNAQERSRRLRELQRQEAEQRRIEALKKLGLIPN
eukprot:764499-Hanusia_phi.AAC.7